MTNFLEPWYEAQKRKIGVVIRTNKVDTCKSKLYAARADARDPSLAELSIIVSPIAPETELWIVRRNNGQQQQREPDETFDVPI